MSIALISTGTELLRGSTCNTNSCFLGRELVSRGGGLAFEMSVADRAEDISFALSCALHTCDEIVVTGGLGPTDDDVTLEIVARFFGAKLVMSDVLKAKIDAFWHRLHKGHCPKKQYKQALLPENGKIIDNPAGSASGIFFESLYDRKMRRIFLAPGPPCEFEPMAQNFLVPMLLEYEKECRVTTGFLAAGIGESTLDKMIAEKLKPFAVEIGVTSSAEGTRLFLSGSENEVQKALLAARQSIGDAALPDGETKLFDYVGKLLIENNLTLGVAESCTGGLIAKRFTDLAGISAVFQGGVVSYSNELKKNLLGVPEKILSRCGAVSAECCRAMVEGVCRASASSCGIATTGIAGPGGGTAEKPVGLVYIGVRVNGRCEVVELHLRGSRPAIRERAAAQACNLLREMILKEI
ncbi:MAG: CinA family nicotinamide mononucleotide deamidase-related protein [Victivallaceae bacterium]|nr:CinA family nicotinamide mononucleotide deamidase-related protein [Victivallaceae bacterium]